MSILLSVMFAVFLSPIGTSEIKKPFVATGEMIYPLEKWNLERESKKKYEISRRARERYNKNLAYSELDSSL